MKEIEPTLSTSSLSDLIEQARGNLAELLRIWKTISFSSLSTRESKDIVKLARSVLDVGAPLSASEIARAALSERPSDIPLLTVYGLILRRIGALELANQVLDRAWKSAKDSVGLNPADLQELCGTLASTHKQLGLALTTPPKKRTDHLRRALELYDYSNQKYGGIWSGVNVAALKVFLCDPDGSKNIAKATMAVAMESLIRSDGAKIMDDRYWLVATLAECQMICGDRVQAQALYREAAAIARSERRFSDLESTRSQCIQLGRKLDLNEDELRDWLPAPRVLCFSGHRFDNPAREQPRLPAQLESELKGRISDWLSNEQVDIGVLSISAGSDLLTCELLLEQEAEVYIVLPCPASDYLAAIERDGDGAFLDRIRQCLVRASAVIEASPKTADPLPQDYAYTNELVLGVACLRAESLGGDVHALAVWNEEAGDGIGGTAHAVGLWRSCGVVVSVLHPQAGVEKTDVNPSLELCTTGFALQPMTKAILFADFKGFSKLSEDRVQLFFDIVFGAVAEIVDAHAVNALARNTWGDGLFLVYHAASDVADIALKICEWLDQNRNALVEMGLPADLAVRIALHAGPARQVDDPITQRVNFAGAHVSQAARLEPATPPDLVYASQSFAAMLKIQNPPDIICRYAGMIDWAKGFGMFPTYRVMRVL